MPDILLSFGYSSNPSDANKKRVFINMVSSDNIGDFPAPGVYARFSATYNDTKNTNYSIWLGANRDHVYIGFYWLGDTSNIVWHQIK